jgi:uncharacterized protein YdeI (BOF family)
MNGTIIFSHNAGNDMINVTGLGMQKNEVITIKEARELPIGTEFEIEGIVTRALGSYTRIQDQTGGITIIQESGTFYNEVANYDIQIADMIHIQGHISEQGFLKVIKGSDLTGHQLISRFNVLPTPIKVTLSELTNNGEMYESCLITLENLTISGGSDFDFQEAKTYQTNDESDNTNTVVIRIGNSEDTDIDGMPFIGTMVTYEGVLSQSSQSDPLIGYQLTPVLDNDLRFVETSVFETISSNSISLSNNYPNPFTTTTTIQYNIIKADFVTLKVSTLLGDEIVTLVNEYQAAGTYDVSFTTVELPQPLSNGLYFYSLKVGKSVTSKQMIVLK